MKMFDTKSVDVVNTCMQEFNFVTISSAVVSRKAKFWFKYSNHDSNELCQLFSVVATRERLSR